MCEIIHIYEHLLKKIQININWGMHNIECNNDGLEVKITHDGPYQK